MLTCHRNLEKRTAATYHNGRFYMLGTLQNGFSAILRHFLSQWGQNKLSTGSGTLWIVLIEGGFLYRAVWWHAEEFIALWSINAIRLSVLRRALDVLTTRVEPPLMTGAENHSLNILAWLWAKDSMDLAAKWKPSDVWPARLNRAYSDIWKE